MQTIRQICGGGKITEDEIVCISPSELTTINNCIVVVTTKYSSQVLKQLKEIHITDIICPSIDMEAFVCIVKSNLLDMNKEDVKQRISELYSILADQMSKQIVWFKVWGWFASNLEMKEYEYDNIFQEQQYMPEGIIQLHARDVIVDCGAYCGDTLEFFLEKGVKFEKYIAYELDTINYEKLIKYIDTLETEMKDKIEVYNMAVGNENKEVVYYSKEFSSFILKGILSKKIEDKDNIKIAKHIILDQHIEGTKISYIKMDIEGAEMDALRGAVNIIKKYTPMCAICVYHLATDLWELPLFLHELNNNYKLVLRHHSRGYYDTVCYAVNGREN